MAEIRWTLQAAEDFDSAAAFIAADSAHYAEIFVDDVFAAIDRLALFPQSGRIVPESGDPAIREVILGNFRLVYRLEADAITILTIYHGSRLLDPSRLK
ncbi:MAG: type II toxin-antitoxin system RelE/ParE family toxin [Planctomycetaceae bacterium]|nr:type II toxin-antitoxin system RelE/ParE family toxin [Planctomycetaceae bacterium]